MGGLLLDAKNRLVKDAPLFRGTVSHASVAPAPLFRQAILAGAAGVILYHNHPSGDPEPSPEDLATTKRFAAAGREIGIEVKDHRDRARPLGLVPRAGAPALKGTT